MDAPLGDVRHNLGNEEVLKLLEDFWRMFAERYRGRTTLWAYDLKNEPVVAWDTPQSRVKWDAWRTARQQPIVPVPGKKDAPSAILADYQRFRESLAEAWVARQATAIHAADPQALVTVGLLQWSVPAQPIKVDQYSGFRPELIARHLDFLSLHFYPLAKDVSRLTNLITTGGVEKAWGRGFGPLVKGLPPARALPARPDLPWESCTMDGAAMTRFQAAYLEAFLARKL